MDLSELLPDSETPMDVDPLGEPDDTMAVAPPVSKEPKVNKADFGDNVFGVDGVERLIGYLERIERLEEEKKALSADIKDIKSEMKGQGFDMKAATEMLKLRKMDSDDREEHEHLRETYYNRVFTN